MATLDDVLNHGGFGLGTFEAVDGEMIVLDGIVYQATFDGSMNVMPPSTGTPFMAVTHFVPDRELDSPEFESFAAFSQWLEHHLPSRNIAYAVRVDGRFANITYPSVARQQRPFQPLADVTRNQTVFMRKEVEGTLMGFWCPDFMNGVNVAGLHLHFLSADRSVGGHVLDLSMNGAKVGIDDTNGWDVQLPMVPAYLNADLGADNGNDLKSAEQGAEFRMMGRRTDKSVAGTGETAPSQSARSRSAVLWRSFGNSGESLIDSRNPPKKAEQDLSS